MIVENSRKIYELYDQFIETFFLKKDSFLSEHKQILFKQTIDACIQNFVHNFDGSNKSFDEKITEQFKDSELSEKLVFAHAEWLWCFAVNDILQDRKIFYTTRLTKLDHSGLKLDHYPKEGFGSAGQWHTNNKYRELEYILYLFEFIFDKVSSREITSIEEVKQWIEATCLMLKYEQEDESLILDDAFYKKIPAGEFAMNNILTYIGFPERYERIASNNHKNRIFNAFRNLLSVEIQEDESLNLDQKLLKIRESISTFKGNDIDFYDDRDLYQIWSGYSATDDFSEIQGIQYKKAIIMYGPPGTSKTHTAFELANALVKQSFLKDKKNIKDYLSGNIHSSDKYIHHLQLHPNFTYEDFVAGYQLKNGESVKTKGILFEICKKAKEDLVHNKPHILILDEINRIDLSKLFGEVFSALENRNKPIEVGVGKLKLDIPSNLYVIGTMNEIDFSLEQIDFALRRRFLWYFYGFNAQTLTSIIDKKNRELKTRLNFEEEVSSFVANATALNNEISEIQELGKQYQIGHTFFGEIVDIYKSYKENKGLTSPRKKLFRNNGPVSILWDISLEPMLTSFLGNIDPEEAKEILSKLKTIYLGE